MVSRGRGYREYVPGGGGGGGGGGGEKGVPGGIYKSVPGRDIIKACPGGILYVIHRGVRLIPHWHPPYYMFSPFRCR